MKKSIIRIFVKYANRAMIVNIDTWSFLFNLDNNVRENMFLDSAHLSKKAMLSVDFH